MGSQFSAEQLDIVEGFYPEQAAAYESAIGWKVRVPQGKDT